MEMTLKGKQDIQAARRFIGLPTVITCCLALACLVAGAAVGYLSGVAEVEAETEANTRVLESLQSVSQLHEEEKQAYEQAIANALLMTDAFMAGGMEKAAEVYRDAETFSNVAAAKGAALTEILTKLGAPPPTVGQSL